ncbi:MAG: ATP phosphoribosyltransferase regulatory subunit [Candidatus Diapherotrites archaeon]|nr:ATP phosphoribosyltransferase regulatory subunit [Candidatus Micrarchaeota archaeon]MBU1940061.1 ATP phosphoribosyltransferase regulatory subunit [Candidatus Micrarchaeota archaeon]
MELMIPRGMRDYLPEDKIIRDKIVQALCATFELYGYAPLETPAVERFDVLSSKFAGGEEILKESFKLKDQGGRELGLRYDLTVPLARVVGMNPQIKMPFKRYAIGRVWRDGPVAGARYREFMQADVDVIGAKGMLADAECLAIVKDALARLGFKFEIFVNNRKLLNAIVKKAGIAGAKAETVILTIDKLDKIGRKGVENELREKKIAEAQIEALMEMLSARGENEKVLDELQGMLGECAGVSELRELLRYCKLFGVEVQLNVSLARGLSYYTGSIFEVFLKDSKVKSAVVAGGRYDEMIGALLGRGANLGTSNAGEGAEGAVAGNQYPAVGLSFGVERLFDAMKERAEKGGVKAARTNARVFVIPVQAEEECVKFVQKLRAQGVNADMDIVGRGPSKNLDFANKMGIPYVIVLGKRELEKGEFALKDMESGKERKLKIKDIKKLAELVS